MITRCFCSIAFRNDPIEEILPRLAQIGYDGVEIWGNHIDGKSPDDLRALRRLAADCGIAIEVLSPYFWLTNSEALRRESLATAERFVGYCHELGCHKIRTFTDAGPTGIGSAVATPEHWRVAVDSLRTITALDRDVSFVVETHPLTLADTPASSLRLLHEVEASNLCINFQPIDHDFLAAYRQLQPYIAHIHLQNLGTDGKHTYLENGVLDLPALFQSLRNDGYDESLSVEYCWAGVDWKQACTAFDYLQRHTPARALRIRNWERWLGVDPDDTRDTVQVDVPDVWQSSRPDYDGVGWYRRTFTIDKEALKGRLRLRCGAANYAADVIVNGTPVARHEGGYTPFVADLTDALRPGENDVRVRVVGPPRDYPVEGLQGSNPIHQTTIPSWKTGWYHAFGGIWQPVHLLRTPVCWLEDAFIQPRLTPRGIDVDLRIENTTQDPLEATLRCRVGTVATEHKLIVPPGGTTLRVALELPEAALWELDQPALHRLRVVLHTPAGTDARSWRFGLREFTSDGRRFLLNGRPVYLRGVLQQGLYPRTLATPDSPELARRELHLLRQAGVNMIRAHLKPTPEHLLDLTDEMGFLVFAEPPIGWVDYDEHVERRIENEIRELVLRDRNRPSVVLWTFFNEMSDTRYAAKQNPEAMIARCCRIGAGLDPTRLMTGNSGRGCTATDIGFGLFGQGRSVPLPMADEHVYRRVPVTAVDEVKLRDLKADGGGLLWISEFGTSSFPDLDELLSRYSPADHTAGLRDLVQNRNYRDAVHQGFNTLGPATVFPTMAAFHQALAVDHGETLEAMQRAFRCNPDVAGYAVTQLADAASEFGGILDLWRHPKPAYDVFTRYNKDCLALIAPAARWVYPGRTTAFDIWVSNVSGKPLPVHGECRLFTGDTCIQRWPVAADAAEVTRLLRTSVVLDKGGEYRLELNLHVGSQLCEDRVTIHAVDPVVRGAPPIALFDNSGAPRSPFPTPVARRLIEAGFDVVAQGEQHNDLTRPVLVHLQGRTETLRRFRATRVLRNEVMAGRPALFVDCDFSSLSYFFGDQTPRELYGVGSYAGNPGVALRPDLFACAGPHHSLGRAYAGCYPHIMFEAPQCRAMGWEIMALHALPDQFGHPDIIDWGASLVGGRLGKGRWLACSFRLLETLGNDPAGDALLVSLLRDFNR